MQISGLGRPPRMRSSWRWSGSHLQPHLHEPKRFLRAQWPWGSAAFKGTGHPGKWAEGWVAGRQRDLPVTEGCPGSRPRAGPFYSQAGAPCPQP